MSDGLEDAYMAVEQAYGQGDFATALNLATELLALVPAGREDLLDHRLHLMIGHIHGFGLGQPAQAAAAYALVLATCTNPAYRDLASQGLARTGGGTATPAEVAPETAAAMPWLSDMQAANAGRTAVTTADPQIHATLTPTAPTVSSAPLSPAVTQNTAAIITAQAARFSDEAWAELNRCLLVIELNDSLSGSDG
jgi:hypothetical protein